MKSVKLVGLIMFLSLNTYAHVVLDKPTGSITKNPGDTLAIEWHIARNHPQNNWDLYYSIDNGLTWIEIALDLPISQLTYSWTIPNVMTSAAKIKIVMDNEGANYEDISESFGIGEDIVTAIDDNPFTNQIKVYPNPFSTVINFELSARISNAKILVSLTNLDNLCFLNI